MLYMSEQSLGTCGQYGPLSSLVRSFLAVRMGYFVAVLALECLFPTQDNGVSFGSWPTGLE